MAAADLQVKLFPPTDNAHPPQRMSERAVGFDFYAEEIILESRSKIWYRTGYGVNIPDNCFGDLRARSSVSETGLLLANGAGVVDPDYQGEVQFRFYKNKKDVSVSGETEHDHGTESIRHIRQVDIYKPGDRIGQLIVVPQKTRIFTGVEVVEDFEGDTKRGEGGFGSTGQ